MDIPTSCKKGSRLFWVRVLMGGTSGRLTGVATSEVVVITVVDCCAGRSAQSFPANRFMLLEPFQSRQAERVVRKVAQHQAMPGSRLVKAAHLLTKVRQSLIKLRVRL